MFHNLLGVIIPRAFSSQNMAAEILYYFQMNVVSNTLNYCFAKVHFFPSLLGYSRPLSPNNDFGCAQKEQEMMEYVLVQFDLLLVFLDSSVREHPISSRAFSLVADLGGCSQLRSQNILS